MFVETSALVDNGVEKVFQDIGGEIMKKIRNGVIDVNIEEYGVKKAGRELLNYSEYDRIVKKNKKDKKKCNC